MAYMEAYIEYVILDNFAVDLLIMLIVIKLLRLDLIKIRLFLCVLLGTAGAVIMPIVPFVIAVIIRIMLAPLMCIIATRYSSVRQYILTLVVMVMVTFAIGGAILGIFNMTVSDNYLIMHYPQGGIIGLTVLGVLFVSYVLLQLEMSLRIGRNAKSYYLVGIEIDGVEHLMKGFYDSGNSLYDKGLRPVVIASLKHRMLVETLVENDELDYTTISGKKRTKSYIISKVKIYIKGQVNTLYNISAIVSQTSFNHYDLLLHKDMIKEG